MPANNHSAADEYSVVLGEGAVPWGTRARGAHFPPVARVLKACSLKSHPTKPLCRLNFPSVYQFNTLIKRGIIHMFLAQGFHSC